jgi:hypothetical protein
MFTGNALQIGNGMHCKPLTLAATFGNRKQEISIQKKKEREIYSCV